MIAFINEHRDTYGVEPICKVLPIAPSTYRLHAARQRDPSLLPDRARRKAWRPSERRRVSSDLGPVELKLESTVKIDPKAPLFRFTHRVCHIR